MSDSDEDWFDKDIDEFVVKTSIKDVGNVSMLQPGAVGHVSVHELLGNGE